MASISAAATAASSFVQPSLLHTPSPRVSSVPVVLGLPAMSRKGRVIKCCAEGKRSNGSVEENEEEKGIGGSLMAAAAVCASAAVSSPVMALVDDRMSTEGTGLPFGLSNNILGWILLGVFGLIWSLYTVYTSGLDEDEESGLSL
ncbi:Photosystem II reaction center W protein, chloroplastic [Linum grandiflorum]